MAKIQQQIIIIREKDIREQDSHKVPNYYFTEYLLTAKGKINLLYNEEMCQSQPRASNPT